MCLLVIIKFCFSLLCADRPCMVKGAVLWNIALCSMIDLDRRFTGSYCIHHITLIVNAESASEMSGSTYQTDYEGGGTL
jgi:hypothetical protein